MPFLPIDLQTMFGQMNQVGREQAVQKEIAPLLQALQGNEIARKTEQQDTSVTQTSEVGDGVESVKEEGKQENRRRREGKPEKKASDVQAHSRDTFKDPDLGHYVDIKG